MYSFSAHSRSQSFSLIAAEFVSGEEVLPFGLSPVSLLQPIDNAVAKGGLELNVLTVD